MNKNAIELLSPAGSFEALKAAVASGCDAVYFGGKNFNARGLSENFDQEGLGAAIDYCHLRGVKAYITVNTLYKEGELKDVLAFCSYAYSQGADALILQDIGLASYLRKHLKGLPLFASTQLTAHSLYDAEYLKEIGFSRIILSRELSLKEAAQIAKRCGIETEIFVHGALCVCYSGQCLMSSVLGQRSGNRGKCAQPCRLNYGFHKDGKEVESGFLLSPRDMKGIDMLEEIIEAGITSIKIEGRMKAPEYVACTTKAYKDKINSLINPEEVKTDGVITDRELAQVFNRGGGFSKGYLSTYAGSDMISIKTSKSTGTQIGEVVSFDAKKSKCEILLTEPLACGDGIEIWCSAGENVGTGINKAAVAGESYTIIIEGTISPGDKVYKTFDKKLSDKLAQLFHKDIRKLAITGSIVAKVNQPLTLTLTHGDISVVCQGELVEQAQSQQLSAERLISQCQKAGSTTFSVVFEHNEIDNDIYINIGQINALRRTALEEFAHKLLKSTKKEAVELIPPSLSSLPKSHETANMGTKGKQLSCLVRNEEQLAAAITRYTHRIYFEVSNAFVNNIKRYSSMCRENGVQLFAALPRISRDNSALEVLISALEENSSLDGYLVRTFGQLKLLKDTDKKIVLDYSFNAYNSLSNEFLSNETGLTNIPAVSLSPELNLPELRAISTMNNEIVVYGRLPLMVTVQCPVGLYEGKKREGKFCLKKGYIKEDFYLKDRKGLDFPVVTSCESCYAEILNSRPIFMADKLVDLMPLNVGYFRLCFTTEGAEFVKGCVKAHGQLLADEAPALEFLDRNKLIGTHGHFYRGVF